MSSRLFLRVVRAPGAAPRRSVVARLLVAFRNTTASDGKRDGSSAGVVVATVWRVLKPLAHGYTRLLRWSSNADVFLATDTLAWARRLEASTPVIRDELDRLRAGFDLPALVDLIPGERYVADRQWRLFMLRYFGRPVAANCALCPRTAALLDGVPGLLSANFSVLQPGARIAAHHGIFGGVLRYHLGVVVPARAADCGIRVEGETRHWREGASLLFDDTRLHEAWNDADEDRVVLMLDVVRPLPAPLRWLNEALVRGLARWVMPPLVRRERLIPSAVPGTADGGTGERSTSGGS